MISSLYQPEKFAASKRQTICLNLFAKIKTYGEKSFAISKISVLVQYDFSNVSRKNQWLDTLYHSPAQPSSLGANSLLLSRQ